MINEHDLKDFPDSPYAEMQSSRLYELNNNTDFFFMKNKYKFLKPDGTYAIIQDLNGNRGNLYMATIVQVPKVKDNHA